MPWAQGCVCRTLITPAGYRTSRTSMPVSGSVIRFFRYRARPNFSLNRSSQGRVAVSTAITVCASTGSSSVPTNSNADSTPRPEPIVDNLLRRRGLPRVRTGGEVVAEQADVSDEGAHVDDPAGRVVRPVVPQPPALHPAALVVEGRED